LLRRAAKAAATVAGPEFARYDPDQPTEGDVVTSGTASPNAATRGGHICSSAEPCAECLAGSSLAAELTRGQVDALFKLAKVRRLSKDDVLISEGETDGPLFVVAKGELEVARALPGDSGISLARLGPGMMAGELTFVDGLKRTATVTSSANDTYVFAIARKDVEAILQKDPLLVYRVMRAILRSATTTVDEMNRGFADSMRYVRG
jgi:signal-transduction protein with cAMP-binding, CBS, and nucleotidyltransferase domain